jgi:glutathione S-transferase
MMDGPSGKEIRESKLIKLYQIIDSTCCMKVRFGLAEKRIAFDSVIVKSHQFEQMRDDYRALNPYGFMPTLVDGENVIIQSSVIQEYLDERFPEHPLRPATPTGRAKMREWMRCEEEFLFKLVGTLTFHLMIKLRPQAYGLEQIQAWADEAPDRARAAIYLKGMTAPSDPVAVREAEQGFIPHLARLEKQLIAGGGPWICGADFSLADISVASIVDRLEDLGRTFLWADLPQVTAWYARIKDRPAFASAIASPEDRLWGPNKPVPLAAVAST